MKTHDEKFTCENCGETYNKAWTDEEAALEMNREFGDFRGEIAVVCDDCYKQMVPDAGENK